MVLNRNTDSSDRYHRIARWLLRRGLKILKDKNKDISLLQRNCIALYDSSREKDALIKWSLSGNQEAGELDKAIAQGGEAKTYTHEEAKQHAQEEMEILFLNFLNPTRLSERYKFD